MVHFATPPSIVPLPTRPAVYVPLWCTFSLSAICGALYGPVPPSPAVYGALYRPVPLWPSIVYGRRWGL